MKGPYSTGFLLDQVFSDLDEASRIRIECTGEVKKSGGKKKPSLRLVSVNSFTSELRYLNFMRDMKATTVGRLGEALAGTEPSCRDTFLDMAARRIRHDMRIIYRENTSCCNCTGIPVEWNPRFVHFIVNGRETHDPAIIEAANRISKRYTSLYFKIIQKFEFQVDNFICLPVGGNSSGHPRQDEKPLLKHTFNGSVDLLGVFLRVLCDREVIVTNNITELVRQFTIIFKTPRKDDISPGSLRNSFACPDIAALESLLREFNVSARFIEKLIEQIRR